MMEQIPLSEALICINCNTISRRPKRACPHCAGEHLVPIGKWLAPIPAPPAPRESYPIPRLVSHVVLPRPAVKAVTS